MSQNSASPATSTQQAPKRALLVVDVQRAYVTGGLRIEYPPIDQSLANIGLAMDAANAHGVPVVVVQHVGFGESSHDWELHEVVTSRASSHHINKTFPSVFTDTDLAAWMAAQGIDTLSVVGYMTQNCNASTVFEARHRGVHVEYLSDASGAVPYANKAGSATAEEIHRVLSVIFESNFAAVLPTRDWVQAVANGQATKLDNVMDSNRRAVEVAGRAA
jgi:nicotinamidase-related amidase